MYTNVPALWAGTPPRWRIRHGLLGFVSTLEREAMTVAGTSGHVLARWLKQRQELLVGLVDVAKVAGDGEQFRRRLVPFCETLVDYVSAGHFEVYALLLADVERGGRLAETCRRIDQTTEAALRFNDAAEALEDESKRREALAHLGLALEERFELEDGLARRAALASV